MVVRGLVACGLLLGLASCAELEAMNGPQTADMTSPPPPPQQVYSYADQPDTPPQIKAKGVIDKGDTTGTYNGAQYVCADAQCKSAIRSDIPVPPEGRTAKSEQK
jgi:hypothetical protein